MKVKRLGANKLEIETEKATVFFSYQTPVAALLHDGSGFIRINKKWSVTTSRHITQWLQGAKAQEVDQTVLDSLLC
jgi:hypothetical protein